MVQLGHPALRPVLADDGQYLAEHVWLGDGAVDVADHHPVVPLPPVDVGMATLRALVLRRHAERDRVGALLQLQVRLLLFWLK